MDGVDDDVDGAECDGKLVVMIMIGYVGQLSLS